MAGIEYARACTYNTYGVEPCEKGEGRKLSSHGRTTRVLQYGSIRGDGDVGDQPGSEYLAGNSRKAVLALAIAYVGTKESGSNVIAGLVCPGEPPRGPILRILPLSPLWTQISFDSQPHSRNRLFLLETLCMVSRVSFACYPAILETWEPASESSALVSYCNQILASWRSRVRHSTKPMQGRATAVLRDTSWNAQFSAVCVI